MDRDRLSKKRYGAIADGCAPATGLLSVSRSDANAVKRQRSSVEDAFRILQDV